MINGDIYLTTDPNVVVHQCITPNTIVMFLQDAQDIDQNLFRTIGAQQGNIASSLLPDYPSFMSQLEKGNEEFENSYFRYLQSQEPLTTFMLIIASLCKGNNIILYTSKDHADTFVPQLMKYAGISFGLIIGFIGTSMDRPCSFDLNYTKNIIELLYLFNFYTIEELFTDFPKLEWFSDNVVIKLSMDMQPYMKNLNPTLEDYALYFYNYKEQVKTIGKFLKPMVHRG